MEEWVSKTQFKSKALAYFRAVEESGKTLVITDRGRPVLQLEPYQPDAHGILKLMRGTVVRYDEPLAPVAQEEWDALR